MGKSKKTNKPQKKADKQSQPNRPETGSLFLKIKTYIWIPIIPIGIFLVLLLLFKLSFAIRMAITSALSVIIIPLCIECLKNAYKNNKTKYIKIPQTSISVAFVIIIIIFFVILEFYNNGGSVSPKPVDDGFNALLIPQSAAYTPTDSVKPAVEPEPEPLKFDEQLFYKAVPANNVGALSQRFIRHFSNIEYKGAFPQDILDTIDNKYALDCEDTYAFWGEGDMFSRQRVKENERHKRISIIDEANDHRIAVNNDYQYMANQKQISMNFKNMSMEYSACEDYVNSEDACCDAIQYRFSSMECIFREYDEKERTDILRDAFNDLISYYDALKLNPATKESEDERIQIIIYALEQARSHYCFS